MTNKYANVETQQYMRKMYAVRGNMFMHAPCRTHPNCRCGVASHIESGQVDSDAESEERQDILQCVSAGIPCVDNSGMNQLLPGDAGRTCTVSGCFSSLSDSIYQIRYIRCIVNAQRNGIQRCCPKPTQTVVIVFTLP